MADQITALYQAALNKGVLAEGLTEDMFRQQTSTEEGLRSFYDYATNNGMKLDKWDSFYSGYLKATEQPAQQVQQAGAANSPRPVTSMGGYNPVPIDAQPFVEEEEAKKQTLQRQRSATLPISDEDKARQAEIERLQREGAFGKPNGIFFGIDKTTGLPTITQREGDGVHLYLGYNANQSEIDLLKSQQPAYMTRGIHSDSDIVANIMESWTANTTEGRDDVAATKQMLEDRLQYFRDEFDNSADGKAINDKYSQEYQAAFDKQYGKRLEQINAGYIREFERSQAVKDLAAQVQAGRMTEAQANAAASKLFAETYNPKYQQAAKQLQDEFNKSEQAQDINKRLNDEYNAAFNSAYGAAYEKEFNEAYNGLQQRAIEANKDYYEGRRRELHHNITNKMIGDTEKRIGNAERAAMPRTFAGRMAQSVVTDPMYGFGNSPAGKDDYLMAARSFLYKAKQRMADMSADQYQFGDFTKNVGYDLGGIIESTMSFGLSDVRDRKVLAGVMEKVYHASQQSANPDDVLNNPETVLSEKELAVYDAYCTMMAADIARQTDTSYLASAAKLTAEMIPFMLEVGAMNGIFGGLNRAAQSLVARGLARSIGRKLPRLSSRSARAIGGLTSDIVRTSMYAAESGATALVLPRTYANMLQNKIDVADGGIDFTNDRLVIKDFAVNTTPDAFVKAWRDQWKELFTETGGVFNIGGNILFKNAIAKKTFNGIKRTELGKVIDTFSSGRYFEYAKQMGYHGTYKEWLEEVEATGWDYVFGDEDAFAKFFTRDTQIPMLISFSVPAVIGGGINAASELKYRNQYKTSSQKILDILKKHGYTEEDFADIKNNLYTYQVGDLPTEIARMASTLTNAEQFGNMYGEYVRLTHKKETVGLTDDEKQILETARVYLFESTNPQTEETKQLASELTRLAYAEVALSSIDREIGQERGRAISMARGYLNEAQAEQEQATAEQHPQDRQTQLRQQATEAAQAAVQNISHEDGNIYRVGIKGKDDVAGYAFRGDLDVVPDKDGAPTTRGRDLITIKMDDGTTPQVPADELVILDAPQSAQERIDQMTEHYFAQYANNDLFHVGDKVHIMQNGQPGEDSSTIVGINDEGVEVEIIDPNGQPNTTVIPHEQAAEMLSKAEGTEDGIVTFQMRDGNTVRLRDMGNGVYNTIVPDGEQPEIFTEEELAEAGAVRADENSGQGEFVIPQEEGYEYGKPTNIRTSSKRGVKLADITRTHIDKDGNKVTEVITIKKDGTNVISGSAIPLVGYRIAGMDAETFEGVEVVGFTKLTELPQRTRVVDGRDADGNNIYREQDAIGELILKDENGIFRATVPLIRTAPVGESNQNPQGLDTQTPMGNGNETPGVAPAYPTDEEGNPAWNQIEVPQAAQILYDTFKQNNTAAISYADDQLKEAEKVQRQAAKQKSHSLNIAQRIAEDEQNAAFKAAADAAVKYWQDVKLAIGQIKTAEEQAAQAAQQQLLQQAREQRSKTEEGTTTAPTMAERYNAAAKIEGNTGTMTLPDGRELSGRYMLITPQGVTPSHDVTKNFQRSEGYPVTADGQSINDRDYTADKEEQQKVVSIAQNFNGNAIKNMPVISDEGMVYNGNGRMMAGQLAAINGTDAAYTQSLMNNAAQYGFTPEQVASIPNARVVFQLDERLPYSTQSLAIFNEQETQTQSNTGKAAGYARKLTPQAVSDVLSAVDGFNTIDAFFSDKKAPFNLINSLINAGIIAQREKAEMVDGDKLSATGRERLSNILFGTVFDNETIRLMGDDAALKNSILRALPQILENKSLGEFSLESDINDAIRLLYEVRRAGVPFRSFVSQTVIAEDGQVHTAAEGYSPFQLLLAEEMSEGGVDAFRDVLTAYNNEARNVQGGQVDIFGDLLTPTELKNLILQRYGKEPTETERPSAGRQTDNAAEGAPASNEQEVSEPEKPLKSLADVKKFMDSIGYNGGLSKVLTDAEGKKFVKYKANGVVMPNIYLGETTPRDIFEQFYLYDNVMEVDIPADIQTELEQQAASAKEVRDELWADDREQVKQILSEEGIPFVDVIDSERGSRIIFTDRKNENGNYIDYMDVSDADQAREDIEFIRAKAESYKPASAENLTPLEAAQKRKAERKAKKTEAHQSSDASASTATSERINNETEAQQPAEQPDITNESAQTFIGKDVADVRKALGHWWTLDSQNAGQYIFDRAGYGRLQLSTDEKGIVTAAYFVSHNGPAWFAAHPELKEEESNGRDWESELNLQKPTTTQELLNNIDAIISDYSDRKMASIQAVGYIEQYPDLAKQLMNEKGISTREAFDKWLANRQGKLRSGVNRRRAELTAEVNVVNIINQAQEAWQEEQAKRGEEPAQEQEQAEPVRAKHEFEVTISDINGFIDRCANNYFKNYALNNDALDTFYDQQVGKHIIAGAPYVDGAYILEVLHTANEELDKLKGKRDKYSSIKKRVFSNLIRDIQAGLSQPVTTTEPAQQPTQEPQAASQNTIFTEEEAERVRARMRARRNRLNMGIDPEQFADGVFMAGYYMEKGVRKFADFARAMLNEFGEWVRPYLKQWYMGLRYDPRAVGADFVKDMDDIATVDTFDIDNFDANTADNGAEIAQSTINEENNVNNSPENLQESEKNSTFAGENSKDNAAFEVGQKITYHGHEGIIEDVNSDGTYNISVPNGLGIPHVIFNISEDELKAKEPKASPTTEREVKKMNKLLYRTDTDHINKNLPIEEQIKIREDAIAAYDELIASYPNHKLNDQWKFDRNQEQMVVNALKSQVAGEDDYQIYLKRMDIAEALWTKAENTKFDDPNYIENCEKARDAYQEIIDNHGHLPVIPQLQARVNVLQNNIDFVKENIVNEGKTKEKNPEAYMQHRYTLNDWEAAGTFGAREGQRVEEEIVEFFRGEMAPAYDGIGVFQAGEAVSHDKDGVALYHTFERDEDNYWVYKGKQPQRIKTPDKTTTRGVLYHDTNTRTGKDMILVKLHDKVSDEEYSALVKLAKSLGGNYSRYKGAFWFKTEEDAEKFNNLGEISPTPIPEVEQTPVQDQEAEVAKAEQETPQEPKEDITKPGKDETPLDYAGRKKHNDDVQMQLDLFADQEEESEETEEPETERTDFTEEDVTHGRVRLKDGSIKDIFVVTRSTTIIPGVGNTEPHIEHIHFTDGTSAMFEDIEAINVDAPLTPTKKQPQNPQAGEIIVGKPGLPTQTRPAQPTQPNADTERQFVEGVQQALLRAIETNEKPFRAITDLRKFARQVGLDIDLEGRDDIRLQELVEDAIVRAGRWIVESGKFGGRKSTSAYDAVCKLYDMQPSISQRSSNRIMMQQYSTPVPMSFIADMFAYHPRMTRILEPTAGNGMLVFAVPANKVHANELDKQRLENLRGQNFAQVTDQDATKEFAGGQQYDAVIANPPFGSSPAKEYDGKSIAGLEQQIILNALASMKDDGRAALIIGGRTEYAKNGSISSDKAFWTYLYDHYNVKGVLEMDGDLYKKQGTGFNTRMILIEGRRTEEERSQFICYPPVQADAIPAITDFKQLYDTALQLLNSTDKTNGKYFLRTSTVPTVADSNRPQGNAEQQRPRVESNASDSDGRGESGRGGSSASTGRDGNGSVPQTGEQGARPALERPDASVPASEGNNNRGQGSTQTVSNNNNPAPAQESGAGRTDANTQRNGSDVAPATGDTGRRVGSLEQPSRSITDEKLPYRPHNSAFYLESVAPANMVEAMDKTLTLIEKKNGVGIEEGVRMALGYDTIEELHKALAAEQIDSVAMAIYQMQQGHALIIGDQTGVGKGRQMAALIRYAVRQGHKPIFITQKADLFTDIYRDLVDIGSGDLRPFIFNSDGAMVDSEGNVVHRPLSKDAMKRVLEGSQLPDEYDYAVLTYSQVNTGDAISRQMKDANGRRVGGGKSGNKENKNKPAPKADFLRRIALQNYLFLDESHTAAGESNTGAYLRSIVGSARAVTFASATFAKRPDTMPLYAIRTAMSQANVKPEELIKIIQTGGVTLQEIMSRALTEAGQMVRRERDMRDVQTDWKTIDDPETVRVARENYDKTIRAFNAIIDFQERYIKPLIDDMDKELAATMESANIKKGTKKMGIDNTPFASKTYNYTKQLMLALKVNAIADEVAREIEADRHPVIALESTMESSLDGYENGDIIDEPTFSASLLKGLESVMQYTIKDQDGNDTHHVYKPEDLGPEAARAYYELQDFIREATKDIFISPLDAITDNLTRRGYKVGELTGRNKYVEITDTGKAVVRRRTDKDKKRMQREFNNGSLDVLILNKSASTGISLHASKTFSDQRQRSMIIAQPLSDINDYMQMIGRIDRTGQVHRGYYINLGLPVPAESRFLMMLSTKLKSLNANTTTSQDSESNEVAAPDLLNKYGSQVVVEYMRDYPEIYKKIGEPLKKGTETVHAGQELEEYTPSEEDALRITGRVALLSTQEQEDFYIDVVRRYNDLIRYLNETGNNDLKITVMPLRAKTLGRKVSSEGIHPDGDNPFARNAYVERVEMDVLRKPLKAADVRKLIESLNTVVGLPTAEPDFQTAANEKKFRDRTTERTREIAGVIAAELEQKKAKEEERYQRARAKAEEEVRKATDRINASEKMTAEQKAMAIAAAIKDAADRVDGSHRNQLQKIEHIAQYMYEWLQTFEVGKSYLVPDELDNPTFIGASPAIFCGFKAKDSNITPSTTFAIFATLDGRRRVEIKFSMPGQLNIVAHHTNMNYDAAQETTLDNWDAQIPAETRKVGYIMTGNILQAVKDSQDQMGNYPGQLISYTDIDGNIHDGILMPDRWEPSQMHGGGAPITARLEQIKSGQWVNSQDGEVTIGRGGRGYYTLKVPKTKAKGGKYFLDDKLLKLIDGNFYESRGRFEADVPEKNIEKVVNRLAELDVRVLNDRAEAEFQYVNLDYDAANLTEAQQLATAALVEVLNDNTDLDVFLATDEEASQIMGDDNVEFSIRREPAPKKTGIGYKVFYRGKDGKLYPPMVANPNGEATPVGVWLNADAAPIAGESKTGRPQVKAGGKGTQGGSGQLAYRPGWHLGEIPYALQFNRKDENGEKTLFPKDFVWAEVEYAADNDYQEEAMRKGVNASGKFQHSLAGLKHVPTDGFYRYRTNPNPATDPWIITGAMKVNRVLTNEEVDEIVRAAGREPQVREAMLTPNGTLYGWAIGDRIYLTKDGLNPNSPIHEYSHIWAKAMMRNNREGWQSIVDIFKGTPFWDEVVNDPNYQGLTTDDAICSEVLARYSGQRGAARMEEWAKEEQYEAEQSGSVLRGAKVRQLINRAKQALADFWHWVGTNLFGIKHFDSAEQVADRVLYDMLNQTELGDVSNRYSQVATDAWNKYQYDGELESVRDVADYIEENMPKDATTQPLFDAIDKYRSEEEEDRMLYGERGDLEPFEDAIFAEIEKLMKSTDNTAEAMISGYTQEKQRTINEWYAAHPRPQYQVGETLDHYRQRLEAYQEEEKRFREQLQAWQPSVTPITPSASQVQRTERHTYNTNSDTGTAPAFVPGVRPTPMANETPYEYALRLRQYYQLMRDEKLVAEYVAEINAQADAAAKVLKKNTIVRGLLDAAKPIENFQEWMKQHGATITDESNAYTDTFLATGRVTQANEQMERDIIRPLAKQIGKIIAPDKETGKSRLDGINIVWHNMDVAGTGSKLDGKALTPREIIGVYCQAKDCAEAIEKGLPDRGAKGFLNNLGMSHEDLIVAVESVIPRAELDELWRLINAATHFALNYDYESGRISEDTHTEFYQREFYVPQRGWRERDESGLITDYEPVGKRGNDPYNAALVKAHGRQSLASDPFAYIMSIDASSIVSSENNKIKQKFLQFCLDNEDLGLQTGAFRVKKYWIMNVIDPETGKIKLDEEGNPMMEVSYVAPSAEDLSHDRTIKELIKKKRKEWAKVNQSYLERQSHGELGPQLEAAYKTKLSKIEQAIEDLEQQMHIAWHATNTNITQRTSDEKRQHEVRVLLDGQEYLIEVQDEKLANAINKKFKQHQEQLFNTSQKMRNATRFMSAVLTQYNPEFAASNFARDFQVALATLTAEHPELVGSFLKNFAACQPAVWQYAFNDKVRDRAVFRDSELGRYLQEYFKAGAATGFSYMQDLKSLRQDFDAMVNESNLRRGIKGAVGVFSTLTEVSETAVRFAGYVSARQKGMGINEAAYLSKELTTNFDRAGEVADSGWMSWFSFFRATLNGNIKFLKALKKMPLAYSLIAAAYVAMGMLNQFLNPDDPEDEVWAGDFTRESNFVIGKWRIPTAHFLRMFFAAGVNAAKWMQGEKSFGEATYNTANFASQELLPDWVNVMNWTDWDSKNERITWPWDGENYKQGLRGFMPTPVSPIMDVWFNRDFRGATINREPFAKSQEGTKDILLSKENTLPVYKWLTQAIYEGVGGNMNAKYQSDDPAWRSWLFDTSASSVEHVVEGYMPAGMDMFITLGEAIYDAATGTPTGPDKWPFVRKFYNAYTPERAYMQQYYLLNGRVKEFKRNMDDYRKNDRTKYNILTHSQEYRNYLEAEPLVKKQKENPTTADVQALINANKQWIK